MTDGKPVTVHSKMNGWLKTLGLIALGIVGLSLVVKLIGGQFLSKKSDTDWVTVAKVDCRPVWNEDRG